MSIKYNILGSISLAGLLLFFAGCFVYSQWCDKNCDISLKVASYMMIAVGFTSSLIAKIIIYTLWWRSQRSEETTPLKV